MTIPDLDIDLAIQSPSPAYLFHGSFYRTSILKPGYEHTGVEIRWDVTESNRWLYASRGPEMAAEMAFASALTQLGLRVEKFSTGNGTMRVRSSPVVSPELLRRIHQVYVYRVSPEHFRLVNNQYNGAGDEEFKTSASITPLSVEAIPIAALLARYSTTFLPLKTHALETTEDLVG